MSRIFAFSMIGALSAAVLSGCGWLSSPATQSSAQSSTVATSNANSASTAAAQNQDRALSAWIEALGQKVTGETPAASSPAKTPAAPVVYVDIAAIARRHPAWRLADSLEQKSQSNFNVRFSSSAAPQSPQQPQIPTRSIANSGNVSTRITGRTSGNNSIGAISTGRIAAPTRRESASLLPPLQNTIEARQRAALLAFLSETAQWQESEREARAADLRGALEERIARQVEAAERLLQPETPELPSPEVQLEMTNLRLKLSTKLAMTEQERNAAEARLRELEEQWRRILQEDEAQRRIALERARIEEPRRIRVEGLEQIETSVSTWQQQDSEQRQQAARNQQSLLQQDFGLAQFGIVLPPYQRALINPPSTSRQSPDFNNILNLSETTAINLSSMRALQSQRLTQSAIPSVVSTQQKSSVGNAGAAGALRQRALNESRRWVTAIAKEKGWRVVTNRTQDGSAVDGTHQVLQHLGQS